MGYKWEDYEKAAERGPLSLLWKIMVPLLLILTLGGILTYACGWLGEASTVAQSELGPKALLKKYTWFKDTAQSLQAMRSNIQVAEGALAVSKMDYECDSDDDKPCSTPPRDVREDWAQREAEIRGLKAAFNGLAAEYNANVKKVNWAMMNTENLPNEFTDYISN